jgi:hypothetical protein
MAKTIDQLTALGATPDDSDNLVIDDSGVTKKVTAGQLKGDCVRSEKNNALSTTVGTKIGTATNQLLGFWNATPISQPSNATAIDSVLSTSGLRASGGNSNFATQVVASAGISIPDSQNIDLGTSVGAKLGTATSQKLGFWNTAPVDQPALTADLLDSLQEVGLIASGAGDTPLNLTNGALTCGALTCGAASVASVAATGAVTSSGTAGIGYATGAGGTVTQQTSRTTSVQIDEICGSITMFSAAGSATAATFTVNNSTVGVNDVIILNQRSGTNPYEFVVTAVAAGSFNINFRSISGTATDAPVINFAVIKAVTA